MAMLERKKVARPGQQGFVLVMALVMLLVLTILGVSAMSTTTLQEKMAGNMKDKNLAFQAAETGLIAAERWADLQLNKPVFPDQPSGLHLPSDTAIPTWEVAATWTTNSVIYPCVPGTTSGCGNNLLGLAEQPRYFIEDLGETPEEGGSQVVASNYKGKGTTMIRITANGKGGTKYAVGMLQSTYAREY